MSTFLSSFVLYSAALLLVAIPVFFVARRRRKPSTIRNFAIGAVSTGAVLAIIKVASDRSVQQCLDAGNNQCDDIGSAGMAVVFIGGYVVIALGRAWYLRG